MRLARIGEVGTEKPALIQEDGCARSLSHILNDLSGDALSPKGLKNIQGIDTDSLPIIEPPYRYGPCIPPPSKFVCVGLNYADHVDEAGMELPKEPILFMKSPSSICGPNDDIILPPKSSKVDWEVELGVIIGSRCSYASALDAQNCIAGYCVVNDISERAFQLEGTGQWVKGKSADTFGPIGPWLVTPNEIDNIQDLSIWLKVNEIERQRSNTRNMIFGVAHLVSYISDYMTLVPGDIVSTGTPFGVGLGLTPQIYLQSGDRMALGIDKLGCQIQRVISWNTE